MKKLMMCLVAVSVSVFAAEQKIATVDLEAVIKAHPQTAGNTKLLKDTQASYEKQRDDLRAKFEAAKDKYLVSAGKANDAAAKDRTKAEEQAKKDLLEASAAEKKFMETVESLQRQLGEQELSLFEGTMSDVQEKINAVAKEKKIDLVIDKSAQRIGAPTPIVLFASEPMDITDDVMQKIYDSAKDAK